MLSSTFDSSFWLTGPVILDPTTPFLHHIPVLKSLATRIKTLWTHCQSQAHPINDQAQMADDHPKTRDVLAMSMTLALRFSCVVLLQLPTHLRYQKRVHAAVLRPLVREASKFLVQVEQYQANEGVSFLAPQVAGEYAEEPLRTDRNENETELPVVASMDMVSETTVENSEVERIHRSDVTDVNKNSQLQHTEPLLSTTSSSSSGGATAQLNIATQIGTLPHPVSPTPSETIGKSPPADMPSPPLSKSIDDQATEKDTLQTLVSLASLLAHDDRQGGSGASQSNKDLSPSKSLWTVSDRQESRITLEALLPSPIMSPTTNRPSYLRSAVERQSSIRRGLEADPYLITSSTAKLESAIREANRQIERGRRRSGSLTTSGAPSSSRSSRQPLLASSPLPPASFRLQISPVELDVNEMARKIADAEYMSAMRVEWDIAREIVDLACVSPKAKSTTNLSSIAVQEAPLARSTPRVATEPVNDATVRRSYSAAADRPSMPKKEPSRSASTTTASRPKVNFTESASASGVRSKASLYTSTALPVTPSLSSPSSPYMSRFGSSLASSTPLSSPSSPKPPFPSEASPATTAKAPRIHRLCMEPVPETPSIKKLPWVQGTGGSAPSSSSTTTTESARPRARQGSVSFLISAFEKKCENSETIKDLPPRRAYSNSTLPLRPRPVSSYASLGAMLGPSTTAPICVTMSRPLPTPPVRTPRVNPQKRHSSYMGDFRTLDKTRSAPIPVTVTVPSSNNDTYSVVSDIDDDDDESDETVDLIRVATQSSVASSSSYLHSRRNAVPSAMEIPDGGLDKVNNVDDDKDNESEGSLLFLEVPDPLDSDEWIKNRICSSRQLSTSGSIKSTAEASEKEEEEEDDDDDEPLGNRPSQSVRNAHSMRSMASGSTSSVTGLDDEDMALALPSPALMTPFTWAQSRSPMAGNPSTKGTSYSWRASLGSGSTDAPSASGRFSKLNSSRSFASTSTRSLQRFEEEEEKRSSRSVSSASSPAHALPSSLESIQAYRASGVRSSSTASQSVKDEGYVRRF